jgi:hypothetical protein
METLYRVLIDGELSARLPLVESAERFSSAPQEFCGYGYESDFIGEGPNGKCGEVWEFVTNQPAAMERALNTDPAVVVWIKFTMLPKGDDA